MLGLAAIFENLGFTVGRLLSTGNPQIDPLLMELDLIAVRGHVAFAVKVRVPRGGTADQAAMAGVSWEVGPVVLAAASAARRTLAQEVSVVAPLLVLAGLRPSDSLAKFTQEEQLICLEMKQSALELARSGEAAGLKQAVKFVAPIISEVEERRDQRWLRTEELVRGSSAGVQSLAGIVGSLENGAGAQAAEG